MYSLRKDQRLKSRKKIEQSFSEGKVLQSFPIRLLYLLEPAASFSVKAGFTVSSRHFKRATDRNRMKRLMREAYRTEVVSLRSLDPAPAKELSIFLIFTGRELMNLALIQEKTGLLLGRLQKIVQHEGA